MGMVSTLWKCKSKSSSPLWSHTCNVLPLVSCVFHPLLVALCLKLSPDIQTETAMLWNPDIWELLFLDNRTNNQCKFSTPFCLLQACIHGQRNYVSWHICLEQTIQQQSTHHRTETTAAAMVICFRHFQTTGEQARARLMDLESIAMFGTRLFSQKGPGFLDASGSFFPDVFCCFFFCMISGFPTLITIATTLPNFCTSGPQSSCFKHDITQQTNILHNCRPYFFAAEGSSPWMLGCFKYDIDWYAIFHSYLRLAWPLRFMNIKLLNMFFLW